MAGSLEQPTHQPGTLPRAQVGGQQYRSAESWPSLDVPSTVSSRWPTAALWVPGAYASIFDLYDISLPEDSRHDWTAAAMGRFLLIGAGKINEHLGQRGWPVPLTQWSETVVWANCELAYIGLYRKRGGNTEGEWQNFRDREKEVKEWLRAARDREITPDPRPSDANLGQQAALYRGDRARGWDQPRDYLRGSSTRRY